MSTIFSSNQPRERCDICERFPAKPFTFRTHRGYVVVRTVAGISGTFCRDHAVEAYARAQSGSLKGMWFGTASLVLGTLSSAWDSLKLLGLPDEVRDHPFMHALVKCNICAHSQYKLPGNQPCEKCRKELNVCSCVHCGGFHVARQIISCRNCGRATEASVGLRYSMHSLAFASAIELTARSNIDSTQVDVCSVENLRFFTQLALPGVYCDTALVKHYRKHYEYSMSFPDGILELFVQHATVDAVKFVFAIALGMCRSTCDGEFSRLQRLRAFASRFGIEFEVDTDTEPNAERGAEQVEISGDCWTILGLAGPSSDEAAIKRAYRKKMTEVHPDSEKGRLLPERKSLLLTKEVNEAYEQACSYARRHPRNSADQKKTTAPQQANEVQEQAPTETKEPSGSKNHYFYRTPLSRGDNSRTFGPVEVCYFEKMLGKSIFEDTEVSASPNGPWRRIFEEFPGLKANFRKESKVTLDKQGHKDAGVYVALLVLASLFGGLAVTRILLRPSDQLVEDFSDAKVTTEIEKTLEPYMPDVKEIAVNVDGKVEFGQVTAANGPNIKINMGEHSVWVQFDKLSAEDRTYVLDGYPQFFIRFTNNLEDREWMSSNRRFSKSGKLTAMSITGNTIFLLTKNGIVNADLMKLCDTDQSYVDEMLRRSLTKQEY